MNPQLSLLEARILGVLLEKELTVPDIHPLSLNALTAGRNQKNNRNPVLNTSEVDVQAAIGLNLTLPIYSSVRPLPRGGSVQRVYPPLCRARTLVHLHLGG